MRAKVSVYVATSLDGFIARSNGDVDWLNDLQRKMPPGEDCGYRAFADSVDVLVMGRKTYEQVLTFGQWPYGKKPVVVLSSKAISFPAELPKTVSHSSEEPDALVERLTAEGAGHLYIDGGVTIQRFLAAGLVDEITIATIPVILGEGIPLFGPVAGDLWLECIETRAYRFGITQARYAVSRKE